MTNQNDRNEQEQAIAQDRTEEIAQRAWDTTANSEDPTSEEAEEMHRQAEEAFRRMGCEEEANAHETERWATRAVRMARTSKEETDKDEQGAFAELAYEATQKARNAAKKGTSDQRRSEGSVDEAYEATKSAFANYEGRNEQDHDEDR